METRTIPLTPVLPSRPNYVQVAKYQQDTADLKTLDTLVRGVCEEMQMFQKLDGSFYDRHQGSGNVAVDRPLVTGTTGMAAAGAGLIGLLGLAGTVGLQTTVALVGIAALASPMLSAGVHLLTGNNPLSLLLARETGEFESREGEVVGFWREISKHHESSYSRSAEVEYYSRGKDTAEVHSPSNGPAFAVLENLDRPSYPANLQLPTASPDRGIKIPIEETQAGPWLSDLKRHRALDASRRTAQKLIQRVKGEAEKLARLDDGPQDFRPNEPGHLIVCSPRVQGEFHSDADGNVVSYVQQDAGGRRGFTIEGQCETYYDRGVQVTVDRTTGTLNLAYLPFGERV